jgi:uncharacterized membrane protein
VPFLGHWYVLLVTLGLIGAVIGLAGFAIRAFLPAPDTTAIALSILNERFAPGEIDQQAALRRR